MLQQPRRLGCNAPVIGPGHFAPSVNVAAYLIYCRGQGILLVLTAGILVLLKSELWLNRLPPRLLGLRNGGYKLCGPPPRSNPVRRLPLFIKLPVLGRVLVRRVQNWLVEEPVFHC